MADQRQTDQVTALVEFTGETQRRTDQITTLVEFTGETQRRTDQVAMLIEFIAPVNIIRSSKYVICY